MAKSNAFAPRAKRGATRPTTAKDALKPATPPEKKVTIRVSDNQHYALKRAAVEQRSSINEIVTRLIDNYIADGNHLN